MDEVITQCSIRHLYTLTVSQHEKDALILIAKSMERRRCNHHTLDKPLSTLECFSSVIDSKGSSTNKHRYVVASQEEEVRRHCRGIKGVPLVYVKRSVMVLEPMTEESLGVRESLERGKFRLGLRGSVARNGAKRKREDESEIDQAIRTSGGGTEVEHGVENTVVKRRIRGLKGPNPLSVKKPKKARDVEGTGPLEQPRLEHLESRATLHLSQDERGQVDIVERPSDRNSDPPTKRKRKRKHKSGTLDELQRDLETRPEGSE
ncbi:MAG: hypothetical protein Q9190_002737 [Brigantiaea leucoxantha]